MMFVSLGIGTVVAVALITVVSILTGGTVKLDNAQPVNALVGHQVTGFTLGGLNGGRVVAPWDQGHAGVLIFFASWCDPCKVEMPKVATYLRTHHVDPVRVVGVDTNDARGAGQAFVRHAGVTFTVAFDPNTTVSSGIFHFRAIPETDFVNAGGVVTQVYVGAIPKDQLAKGIAALRSH
jgi:thiol-disulfide isomerase/thioredoxin